MPRAPQCPMLPLKVHTGQLCAVGLVGGGHCSELVLLRASLLQQIPWRQLKS